MKVKNYLKEESQNISKIYVDMDGVLADFLSGVKKLISGLDGLTWSKWQDLKKEHWQTITDTKGEFWRNLNWLPGSKQMWQKILALNIPVEILSAMPKNGKEQAKENKKEWIKKELGEEFVKTANLVMGVDKQKYSGKGKILIDDSERNIEQWREKGGIGILFKNSTSALKELNQIIGK